MLKALVLLLVFTATPSAQGQYQRNPFVIKLDIPESNNSAGGIIVADVDNNNKMDYLITVPGHLAVYSNDGKKLWLKKIDIGVGGQSESQGLPGHCAPGVAAGDVDGDGRCEVVFLTKDSVVHIVGGATGKQKASAKPLVPEGAARWEVAMIADFNDSGKDEDILLQATNKDGYRMGKYLAAYKITELLKANKPLWTTEEFVSCAHNSARLADINGDGRDEVLGETIFSADGKLLTKATPFNGHMDSVFVADVCPDKPGLEVVLLEEGSWKYSKKTSTTTNHVQLIGSTGPIWRNHFKKQEPQNAAIGRFKQGSDEVFIWCRSRYNENQKPFVFDSTGQKVFDYAMDDVAPDDWTTRGVEIINTIDWTGKRQQLACATERHKNGDVCVFEPLTGKFVARFKEKADRLYVADVTGDWREEIIVLNGSELHIYQNTQSNPRPSQKRLWSNRNYRRLKQYHNYYSP
jgi:hypothetical protein